MAQRSIRFDETFDTLLEERAAMHQLSYAKYVRQLVEKGLAQELKDIESDTQLASEESRQPSFRQAEKELQVLIRQSTEMLTLVRFMVALQDKEGQVLKEAGMKAGSVTAQIFGSEKAVSS